MDVSLTEWVVVVGLTCSIIIVDLVRIVRNPHEPSMKECAITLSVYVSLAILFGVWVTLRHGGGNGLDFYTGWLVEYSLSIDNLFIFIIIMSSFKVPRKYQQEALMVGIILALIFRAIFIALGAIAIERFSWVFYIFGAFLLYTAWNLLKDDDHDEDHENFVVRVARKRFGVSEQWDGLKLFVHENGRRLMTPMFLVILALGTTDLMFALDSIPAIYGISREPYIVFTANVFALMGLRQLYFLLGDLINRLVYLSYGLAVILGYIGVKLILHALHENELGFINSGENVPVPEVPTLLSLAVIIVVLSITAVASLYRTRSDAEETDGAPLDEQAADAADDVTEQGQEPPKA